MESQDEQRRREAQRILDRADAEVDGGAMAGLRRSAHRARDHMAAGDADPSDWVEVWGTRIGRGLSLVLLIGLLWWLTGDLLAGL